MLEIIFIRHGETEWNAGRRIMGRSSVPMNERGRAQIERLRDHLEDVTIDRIYSSPVERARQTSQILAADRKSEIIEAPELAEINYGDWVGMTFDEVREQPEFSDYHRRPSQVQVPGGESMSEVRKRVRQFVHSLRDTEGTLRVLAVSHADVIKIALAESLAMPFDEFHRMRIDNGSYSLLMFEGELERVLIVNALPRLDGFFEKSSLFAKKR